MHIAILPNSSHRGWRKKKENESEETAGKEINIRVYRCPMPSAVRQCFLMTVCRKMRREAGAEQSLRPDLCIAKKIIRHRAVTLFMWLIQTYLEGTVPWSSAEGHTVWRDAQARHSIFMSSQDSYSFSLQCIPDIAVEVVVSCKEDSSGGWEGNGCDAA